MYFLALLGLTLLTTGVNAKMEKTPEQNPPVEASALKDTGGQDAASKDFQAALPSEARENLESSKEAEKEMPKGGLPMDTTERETLKLKEPQKEMAPSPNPKEKPEITASQFTASQLAEIETIVERVVEEKIQNKPELIMSSLQQLREAAEAKEAAKAKKELAEQEKRLSAYEQELLDDETALILGNTKGNLKLVVFVDPNCGYCRHFDAGFKDLKADFPDLKIYIRPLAFVTKESKDVVQGLSGLKNFSSEKVEKVFHELSLLETLATLPKFYEVAKKEGVDIKKLKAHISKPGNDKLLTVNEELAGEKKGNVRGTPTFVLVSSKGLTLIQPKDISALKEILKAASQDLGKPRVGRAT